jgi:uracil phosphoribosyltransferase
MYVLFLVTGTGNTVIKALNVLKQSKVQEKNIILLNLFITPQGKNYLNISVIS